MANSAEMVIAEGFGALCILLRILGVHDNHGSALEAVWADYMPLFMGVCLTPLFIRGPFRP
jgi:hypothetical protein